jgi:hypothetical protein
MRQSFREHMNDVARRLMQPTASAGMPSGFGGGNCPPDTSQQSRQYISPQISYFTIPPGPNAVALADVPVLLPIPAQFIMLVGCLSAQNGDSLYMHFATLNKNYGILDVITPTGFENWIPICNPLASANMKRIGWWMKFSQPLPVGGTLYFDIGNESGTPTPLTFALSNSVDFVKMSYLQS